MSDADRDGVALATAVLRRDDSGARLLLDRGGDPFEAAWWCAATLTRFAPTDTLATAMERTWRTTVDDLTDGLAIVTADLLDDARRLWLDGRDWRELLEYES
jgi:hypothetical protein